MARAGPDTTSFVMARAGGPSSTPRPHGVRLGPQFLRGLLGRPPARAMTSAGDLPPWLVVGRREDQGPEHLVLGARRVDRRDPHAGRAIEQHVGAVRRRIPPA